MELKHLRVFFWWLEKTNEEMESMPPGMQEEKPVNFEEMKEVSNPIRL